MGQQSYTLKEVKNEILTKLDIGRLIQQMIVEETIDKNAIKNKFVFDEDGDIDLDLDLSRDNYIEIKCFFHETDNNGSARLKLGENFYKCFRGGCCAEKPMNVIDLYMVLKYNVDPKLLGESEVGNLFMKAIEDLANMIDIKFQYGSRKLTDEEQLEIVIQEIREKTAAIYHDAYFNHKYAKNAQDYLLNERGFKYGIGDFEDFVKEFKFGYAPSLFGWTWLYNRIKHVKSKRFNRKFTDNEILASGVCRLHHEKGDKKNPSKIVDFLTNGVVMPYFADGKVVNLYSRALKANNKNFRHLRLKGNVDVPINWDYVKQMKEKTLIVVEGELSLASMFRMGHRNTIGNRGTNGLSNEHIAMIKRYVDLGIIERVALCFDPDGPGKEATVKTGQKLINEGVSVVVMDLAIGDPNDFLQHYKEKAVEKMDTVLKNANPYEAFMVLHTVESSPKETNADKIALFKQIKGFREHIEADVLIIVASEVAKQIDGISEELLLKAWLGIDPPKTEEVVDPKWIVKNPNLERALINHSWMVLTDNEHHYRFLNSLHYLSNVVYVNDVGSFIKKTGNVNRSYNLVLDNVIDKAVKTEIMNASLSNAIHLLDTSDLEKIKKTDKDSFNQFILNVGNDQQIS